jgi:hypothetical protein
MSVDKSPRKQRSIAATDAEWDAMKTRAERLGIPLSRLIIEKVLEGPISNGAEQPQIAPQAINEILATQREVLHEVLLFSAIACDDMEQRGEGEKLKAIRRRIETRLNFL